MLLSVVLVALIVVAVALELRSIGEVQGRGTDDVGSRVSRATHARPRTGPRIAVIGDDVASVDGVSSGDRWPSALARDLDGEVVQQVDPSGEYTRKHGFLAAAAAVPPTTDLVIISGGGADAGATRLELVERVTEAFSIVRERAPHAAVVVVGPLPPAGGKSDVFRSVRAALRSGSAIAGARFIDPISGHWLDRAERRMSSVSSRRSAQHAIATRLTPQVRDALRSVRASSAGR